MNRPSPRATRIYLPLLVAGLVALATLAMSGRHADAQTHPTRQAAMGSMQTTDVTARQVAFRNAMRVLWEQHVAWTRMAIVSFAGDLPDLPATEQRLLRNQTDIGNAIAPFYGKAAGHRLTALLRQHILIAVDILVDVKAGDTPSWPSTRRRGRGTPTGSPPSCMVPTQTTGHSPTCDR